MRPAAAHGHVHPYILIVRPSALGDVCRTVPVLTTIRYSMPEAWIDWLVSEDCVDAVRHHPALSGVIVFPRRRFGALLSSLTIMAEAWRWARDLKKRHYDMAIDLQGLARSGFFTWATRAPLRLGFKDAREFGWLGYNRRLEIDANLHSVDRMLHLLYKDGYAPQPDMRLYVGPAEKQWLDEFIRQEIGAGQPYVCVAPTARWRCKCWPAERYGALIKRLLDERIAGQRVVIIAAPSEAKEIEPILAAVNRDARVLTPRTTVAQMLALISRARLVVSNDSAPMHAAVGFNRPLVAIFGPTDHRKVGPYRREDAVVHPMVPGSYNQPLINYRRQRNDQRVVSQVTIEQVWAKVVEQVGK